MRMLSQLAAGTAIAALTTIFSASAANAVCAVEIYADRAFSNGSVTSIYGRTGTINTFNYYGITDNPTLANLIFAATAGHTKVIISGNASSCPGSGDLRFVGVLSYAFLVP